MSLSFGFFSAFNDLLRSYMQYECDERTRANFILMLLTQYQDDTAFLTLIRDEINEYLRAK